MANKLHADITSVLQACCFTVRAISLSRYCDYDTSIMNLGVWLTLSGWTLDEHYSMRGWLLQHSMATGLDNELHMERTIVLGFSIRS